MSFPFKQETKCSTETITIGDFLEKYQPSFLLDLNPITQRPAIHIEPDNKKSVGIIESILSGISLGVITIVENGDGYEFKWESLDGGHRKRAIYDFINDKFSVFGKLYSELTKEEKSYFLNLKITLDVYEPMSNYQKGKLFRTLNGTMQAPNHQEILNSFGDTGIANAIRETVRENLDNNHKLFELTDNNRSKWIFNENTRLRLEEFVARIYYRYYVDGFLGSRKDDQLMSMYSDENIKVSSLKKKVDKHLDFLYKCTKERKALLSNKMGWKELNTLSNLYHYFNEKLVAWTIFNYETFYANFYKSFSDYTVDPDKKYGDVVDFEFEGADVTVKECFKNYTTCHDNYNKQEQLIKWILDHPDMKLNQSVRILDEQRLFSKEVKEAAFAKQGYVCGIDGQKVKFEELEAAHDVAYILGGSSTDASNCVMIKKEHNRKMGTMTIAQYKEFLEIKAA